MHEVYDTVTGQTQLIPTPCGATRESKCPPCAAKNRRLRMQQCREGWHLDEEPENGESKPEPEDDREDDSGRGRRLTTRRHPVDPVDRSGRPGPSACSRSRRAPWARRSRLRRGRTYRPSMFLTLTLPSYGRVERDGTPRFDDYDYRRAALDALHFPKLVDRFWQNLRRARATRCSTSPPVEEQHRLAPHLHAAVRGAIPRALMRQVVAATYHQVWWPAHDELVYERGRLPVWARRRGTSTRSTAVPLPTWDAGAGRDRRRPEDAAPAHVVRFGTAARHAGDHRHRGRCRPAGGLPDEVPHQVDLGHLRRGRADAALSCGTCAGCTRRCGSSRVLRGAGTGSGYGVQPLGAEEGMVPGSVSGKAHDFGEPRMRRSAGPGLPEVDRQDAERAPADRASVVRQVLEAAGVDGPETRSGMAADIRRDGWLPRFQWKIWDPIDAAVPMYRQVMTKSIAERMRWKSQYAAAKQRVVADRAPTAQARRPPPRPGTDRPLRPPR